MRRRHGSNFNVDSEAYDIARGLYDSKGKQQNYVCKVWTCHNFSWNIIDTVTLWLSNIIKGLLTCLFQVNIKRPPSAAQRGVYTASCRGPPTQVNTAMKPRPFSAKARITTERVAEKTTAVPKTRPPWRPFSGHAALGRPTPLINMNPDNTNVMTKEEPHYDLPSLPKVYQDRYK